MGTHATGTIFRRYRRFPNATLLLFAACAAVSAMTVGTVCAGQEDDTRHPNIVFILSDDHAIQSIGCYGNKDIQTPALDRLAAEGMRFEHALTPNSFCTPARAAVLTGTYSHKNGVTHLNQRFDGTQQTFPKLLQSAGYDTALFGKWHLLSQPTGFDHYCVMKMQGMPENPIVFEPQHEWIEWSPQDEKSAFQGGRKLKGYNNDVMTDEALSWLKNRKSDKPFCLLLHPKPPHAPYRPAPPSYGEFLKEGTPPGGGQLGAARNDSDTSKGAIEEYFSQSIFWR